MRCGSGTSASERRRKRIPTAIQPNDDSLGIELVGRFDAKSGSYDIVSRQQNESLIWLLSVLEPALSLADDDVYRHPEVSYKQSSEAQSAKWR